MSTRYVWDKTVATSKLKETKTKITTVKGPFTSGSSITLGGSYTFDEQTGEYSVSGGRTYTVDDFSGPEEKIVNANSYPYVMSDRYSQNMFGVKDYVSYQNPVWELRVINGEVEIASFLYINEEYGYQYEWFYEYYHTSTIGSGEHVEYLSGSTSNAYQAGVDSTGQYYLVYLGADSIDPKSVSFSGAEPDSDGNMSVVVTPATNTLVGNILYQYQYSIDNGSSWTNAGDKTAATTKEIPVPPEAEKFMVRVQASDDIGFTSTTYVSTANITVQIMRLWVGVDNSARKGTKLWVGVDGVARRVVRAWVGDENGTARRWF